MRMPGIIDIGYGGTLVVPHAFGFDKANGNAQHILDFVCPDSQNVVFASHVLEDMEDPFRAVNEWWRLVRTEGYIYLIVPDEDLYEQGVWPSRFNPDHRHTFRRGILDSWSPVSIDINEIIFELEIRGGKVMSRKLNDHGYRYPPDGTDQTLGNALAQIEVIVKKIR